MYHKETKITTTRTKNRNETNEMSVDLLQRSSSQANEEKVLGNKTKRERKSLVQLKPPNCVASTIDTS